jgi:hypothetical protein
MVTAAIRPTNPAASPRPNQTISIRRIRFVAEVSGETRLRREFRQPRRMLAVEEVAELTDLPPAKVWPEPTDHCWIVLVPPGTAGDGLPSAEAWLAPPDQAEAVPSVVLERDDERIEWRPGRALVQCKADRREDIVAALTDFAYYEGELRALEEAVEARETQAQADVAFAHRIRQRDRRHWKRFKELIEYFSQLRLTYARLEPRLAKGARTLSPAARQVMTRLLKKADVEARLEALNDRLEAMEDLYEGANDRVADFRWYRDGHLLEVAIVVLLLIEGLVMSADMYIRYLEYQVDPKAAETTEQKAADLSEEFRAVITRVADGQVTFTRTTASKDPRKGDKGDEQTLPLADHVKVAKGKVDKDTNEVEAGEPIAGGLKNEMFTRIADKGIKADLVTDSENKKIAEIYVLPSGRKGP